MAPLPDRSLPHLKVREALLHQLLEVRRLPILFRLRVVPMIAFRRSLVGFSWQLVAKLYQ